MTFKFRSPEEKEKNLGKDELFSLSRFCLERLFAIRTEIKWEKNVISSEQTSILCSIPLSKVSPLRRLFLESRCAKRIPIYANVCTEIERPEIEEQRDATRAERRDCKSLLHDGDELVVFSAGIIIIRTSAFLQFSAAEASSL